MKPSNVDSIFALLACPLALMNAGSAGRADDRGDAAATPRLLHLGAVRVSASLAASTVVRESGC
jgi:hypothetical protein